MTKIKICGITNLADALAAVEAGADELGFNFYAGSARFVEPSAARRIVEQLPREVLCVGVFVNEETPEDVLTKARESGVGAAQLHGEETPEFCRGLKELKTVKALRVGEDFNAEAVKLYETDAVLLDAFCRVARGGTGQTFDWTIARRVRALVPQLYLAGGLTHENVAGAIASVRPDAVDACSGIESAPGKKDFGRVRAFISVVREADRARAG